MKHWSKRFQKNKLLKQMYERKRNPMKYRPNKIILEKFKDC